MKKMIPLIMILFLVGSLAYAETEEILTSDISASTMLAEKITAFSLSPYGSKFAVDLGLLYPYRAMKETDPIALSEYVRPVEPIPKRTGTAIAETMAINVIIWGFAQYGMDAESGAHSYINLDTMRDNLTYWFEWDPNHFSTNFFAHPYHGSLYFNAGRTNGLDFWSSSLLSLGGSFMWEMFMERHRPSINDLIMTTTGGMFLGETLFRFANLVWDDSATGFNRVWREIVGTLLNPIGGLNRLIHGDMSTSRSTPNQIRAPVQLDLSWAGNVVGRSSDLSDKKTSPVLDMLLVYGDPFKNGESRKPFDYFPIQFILRFAEEETFLNIYAYSLLAAKELESKENQNFLIGIFQHYDYIRNEIIELGGSSFCGGIMSRFQLSPKVRLTALGHFGWMVLGASNNEYVVDDLRDYNYGTGFTAKVDIALNLNKFGRFLVRWAQYKIYSLEGADGSDRLNLFQGKYRLPIWKGFGLGIQYTQYRRNSHYVNFPDVKQKLYEFRTLISYQF